MTAEFQYTSRKEMPPRPGVNYATTYYKQSLKEYTLLRHHVYQVAAAIMAECDSDSAIYAWWTTPIKSYRKSTRGQYYTPSEIVTDMVEQLSRQNDVPSGMLGRWNRLFADTAWDIRMTSGTPARPTQFGALFDGT
jgi:hypothetical protein